jgi:uncharacterized protein YecE (DUF72 family)
MSCDIRIGTSGFHYNHWRGRFYPEKLPADQMFKFYLHYFDTVELNNSFYRLPPVGALQRWRDAAPPNFVFSVKASRFITHSKKLKDPENALENLLPRLAHLGPKLGPVLFQLPPKWQVNVARLQAFLSALPAQTRYAFEFRELSWMKPDVIEVLKRFNAAFCIYELAGYHSPLNLTADFAYVRLHGPETNKYQGSYEDDRLRRWAAQIESWAGTQKAIFVYFDNDQAAYAAKNALMLKRMVLGGGRNSDKSLNIQKAS